MARPPQPAATLPVSGRPVAPQTAARRIRPPSSGSPGSRFSTPITRLAPASACTMKRVRPSGSSGAANHATPATASEVSGPTPAITASRRADDASSSIEVTPPRKCSSIECTCSPNALAATACETSCSSTDR